MTDRLQTENQNTGHGWVYPRPDGAVARCGGPAICSECARDKAQKEAAEASERTETIARAKPVFPGTASMYAQQQRLAVTEEWMRGWNACLDAIDRLGGFRSE